MKSELLGTQTQYSIALKGPVSDRWAEAYRIISAESEVYRRFRLDRANGTVVFTCRTVDGAVLVFDMLERLQILLKAVNERVEFWHTQNPAIASTYAARGVA